MSIDSMLLLDALCLALYDDSVETEAVIQSMLKLHKESIKKGDMILDDFSRMLVDLINEILDPDFDINSDADIETILIKFTKDKRNKDNQDAIDRIEKIYKTRKQISPNKVTALRNKIKKTVIVINGGANLKKMFRASNSIMNNFDSNKQDNLFLELINNSRELTKIYEDRLDSSRGSIDFIDMTCPKSIRKGLASYKHKKANSGYKLGLQKLSKMFGESGGPVPGEFIGIGGCSYNYKTGMLMDITRWLAQYNAPRKKTEKPAAIIFISLENEIFENMVMWYSDAYKNIFHKQPDHLNEEEIVNAIIELYAKNGFTLLIYRKEGEDFGFEEWKKLHEEKAQEYEIIASITDYAGLMNIDSNDGENAPKKFQMLINRMKNYGNRNDIIVVTGFQLNGYAEEMAKSGQENVVKKFGAVHLADAKAVKRECDILMFVHVEINHLGDSYLTVRMDKHKYCQIDIPYVAYKFDKELGIQDDIYGEDSSVDDIYAINNNGKTSRDDDSSEVF